MVKIAVVFLDEQLGKTNHMLLLTTPATQVPWIAFVSSAHQCASMARLSKF